MNYDKKKYVFLVRHGETIYNINRRLQNSEDRLTERGKEQIKALAKELSIFKFTKFFSSDERRALESSELISKEINLSFEKNNLIKEKSSGELSGKFISEVDWSEVKGDFYNKKISGGESVNDVIKRAKNFFEIIKSSNNDKILVVSHGSFLRVLFCIMTNNDVKEYLLNYEFPNASYIILLKEGNKWEIRKSEMIKKTQNE